MLPAQCWPIHSLLTMRDHHERCLKTSKHGRCVGRRVLTSDRSNGSTVHVVAQMNMRRHGFIRSEWPPGPRRSAYRRGGILQTLDSIVPAGPSMGPNGWRRREHSKGAQNAQRWAACLRRDLHETILIPGGPCANGPKLFRLSLDSAHGPSPPWA
jgi:hypothetical protein